MVTREAPGAQLRTWKDAWLAYKDRITPNRKTGAQIVRYLQDKYVLEETFEHEACAVVEENVVRNEYNAEKLPPGESRGRALFFVKKHGRGRRALPAGGPRRTRAGIQTGFLSAWTRRPGYFYVEGSQELWDELFVYRGLDALDLRNFALTGQFVDLCRRRGLRFRIDFTDRGARK